MSGLKRTIVTLAAALAAVSTNVPAAADAALAPIPADGIDSGLGELPAWTEWREPWLYSTPADKVDSGLGEMKQAAELQEVWLYAHPAEKIDSGLGELTAPTLAAHARR